MTAEERFWDNFQHHLYIYPLKDVYLGTLRQLRASALQHFQYSEDMSAPPFSDTGSTADDTSV